MINLTVNSEGQIVASQQTESPSVYLDHWAMMDIAQDEKLAERFVKTIHRRKGTLELSYLNLLEFSEVTDTHQINSAESFLEKVYPRFGFIEVNPGTVVQRENRLMQTNEKVAPHADLKFLEFFVKSRKTLDPLNPKGIFSFSNENRLQLAEMCNTFLLELKDKVEAMRIKAKTDPKYNARIHAIPKGEPIQQATRYIYEDIVHYLIRDNINLSNPNNWRDLLHTIVPVAYCDFVVLDQAWANIAVQTVNRLRRTGQIAEMATVFSKRDMDKFWDAFDV